MSQGRAWNKDEVLKVLEPFFKLGCNVAKACEYAGISRTTVQTWIEQDEELRLKVEAWQKELSARARENWAKKLEEGDYNASRDWLERKDKDEFSQRTELTGSEGKDLFLPSEEEKKLANEALKSLNDTRGKEATS